MFTQWRTSRGIGWLTLAAIVAIAAGGGWAVAATTTSSGVIHACASKHGGALRLARRCNKKERAISWNARGIAGKNGTNGTNGATGTNGANGTNGTNGTNGINGINGTNGAPGIAFVTSTVAAQESTASTTPGDLTTLGPSVTVNVPASGLIEVFAQADIAASASRGIVSVEEDGVLLSGQSTDCVGGGGPPRGIISGSALSLATFATVPGQCKTVGPPGLLIFHTTPGVHTYKLVYFSDTGSTVVFRNRLLSVAPGT